MKTTPIAVALFALAVPVVFGCQPETSVDPNVEKLGRATGPSSGSAMPKKEMTPPPAVTTGTHTGTVEEVINVPGYTYLRFKATEGPEKWAAIPTAEIAVGTEVTVLQQMVQTSFKSPSLDRTFEVLIFGTLQGAPAPQKADGGLPAGHPPVEDKKAAPEGGAKMPAGHPPIGEKKDEATDKPAGQPPVI